MFDYIRKNIICGEENSDWRGASRIIHQALVNRGERLKALLPSSWFWNLR